MKILILGSKGFIGSNLSNALSKVLAHEIFTIKGKKDLDVQNHTDLTNYFKKIKPDIIYNCVAHVGSLHYVSQFPADVINDNLELNLSIYKSLLNSNTNALVVNLLSNCSYPGNANIHIEDKWWDGEVHHSVFSYGNSKKIQYIISKCYNNQHNIRTINLLIPNAFGPGDHLDSNRAHAINGMIIRMIKSLNNKESIFEIWGTGNPKREWIYVKDIVNILINIINRKDIGIDPINLAQNKAYSIKTSALNIAKILNFPGEIVFNTKYQDGAKIKKLDNKIFLKYFPDYKFYNHIDALDETVRYYTKLFNQQNKKI